MFRGGGCLGKSGKIVEKETLRVYPELRRGSCPLTKANPGRGNRTSKGLALSCFGILYGAGWEWGQRGGWRRRQDYGRLSSVQVSFSPVVTEADSSHFSTAVSAGCKEGSKGAWAGRLRSESVGMETHRHPGQHSLGSPHKTPR